MQTSSLARPRLATGVYAIALFLALYLIWGATYAIVKIGLQHAPPLTFTTLRAAIAGVALVAYALAVGRRFPRDAATHRVALVLGALNVAGFLALFNLGLSHVSAGESSILTYTQPLLVSILAWLWLGERLSTRAVLGLGVGFLGVVAVMAGKVQLAGEFPLLGYTYALGGAVAWTLGTVYFRARQAKIDLLWATALQSLYGAVPLLALALILERPALTPSFELVWTAAFNGLGSSGIAYVIWFYLLRHRPAGEVSSYIFMVPFFAVLFGALILGEQLGIISILGGALVLVGIALVNRR